MTRLIKLAAAGLLGGLAVSALAGCYASVSVGPLQHRTSSYSVPGQVRTLVVHGQAGDVDVTGTSAGVARVTDHLTFRHTVPVTSRRVSAGTLTLDTSCPALETCTVSYNIAVPQATIVRIHDGAGTIRLDGLSGPVTASTNAGDIDLSSVSGPIEATDHAGSVLGRDLSAVHATLHVSAGKIDATFSAAPAAITASADVGSIALHVPGNLSYDVAASASVGSVRVGVIVNRKSAHTITATDQTGSITIEPAA
ncbi:MAG TPA: DUF4097 family beta strand repeat-containing protein [Streptosporangiaceae bacterium]|nr:DUF4097 family beta strand repeat-containing protein [Streptosporangiaceae bacterium]